MTHVLKGLLGWSNKRTGLEFYMYDEKIIPRHSSEWGDLLADKISDEIGNMEGCPVIVVVMDRSSTANEVQEMASGIAGQVVEYN